MKDPKKFSLAEHVRAVMVWLKTNAESTSVPVSADTMSWALSVAYERWKHNEALLTEEDPKK